jgi:hypothetical protein
MTRSCRLSFRIPPPDQPACQQIKFAGGFDAFETRGAPKNHHPSW